MRLHVSYHFYLIILVITSANKLYTFQPPDIGLVQKNPYSYLADYEQRLWNFITATTTITQEDCSKKALLLERLPTTYQPAHLYTLSESLREQAQNVAYDFNISNVTFKGSTDYPFAFTVRSIIYIDQERIQSLLKDNPEQHTLLVNWIIAHELIHVIYKDSLILQAFRILLMNLALKDKLEHYLCQILSRFMECRADLLAAVHNLNYQKGYYLYTHQHAPTLSYQTLPSHLTLSERKELALALAA